jgi:hypothetical protein
MPIGNFISKNVYPSSPQNRQGSQPDLTQDQSSNAPYGQGDGIYRNDQIPNVTRKAQYAAEGNDLYSQSLTAGDQLIHDSGLDYGSGSVDPENFDMFDALHNTAKSLYGAITSEKNRIRPSTSTENLNESFLKNVGPLQNGILLHDDRSNPDNPRLETLDSLPAKLNRMHEEDMKNGFATANDISKMSTEDLANAYDQQLSNLRNRKENAATAKNIYQARVMHNELKRRGFKTNIWNHDNSLWEQDPDIRKGVLDDQIARHNGQIHLFHENAKQFHKRTAAKPLVTADVNPAPPPAAAPLSRRQSTLEDLRAGRISVSRVMQSMDPDELQAAADYIPEREARTREQLMGGREINEENFPDQDDRQYAQNLLNRDPNIRRQGERIRQQIRNEGNRPRDFVAGFHQDLAQRVFNHLVVERQAEESGRTPEEIIRTRLLHGQSLPEDFRYTPYEHIAETIARQQRAEEAEEARPERQAARRAEAEAAQRERDLAARRAEAEALRARRRGGGLYRDPTEEEIREATVGYFPAPRSSPVGRNIENVGLSMPLSIDGINHIHEMDRAGIANVQDRLGRTNLQDLLDLYEAGQHEDFNHQNKVYANALVRGDPRNVAFIPRHRNFQGMTEIGMANLRTMLMQEFANRDIQTSDIGGQLGLHDRVTPDQVGRSEITPMRMGLSAGEHISYTRGADEIDPVTGERQHRITRLEPLLAEPLIGNLYAAGRALGGAARFVGHHAARGVHAIGNLFGNIRHDIERRRRAATGIGRFGDPAIRGVHAGLLTDDYGDIPFPRRRTGGWGVSTSSSSSGSGSGAEMYHFDPPPFGIGIPDPPPRHRDILHRPFFHDVGSSSSSRSGSGSGSGGGLGGGRSMRVIDPSHYV